MNVKTNELVAFKARKLLINKYSLNKKIEEIAKEYECVNVVLFNASIKRYYSAKVLEDIKSKYSNVKLHLFFMDPSTIWASKNAIEIIEDNKSLFDNIFTVDSNDAREKGWIYWPTPYSKLYINISEKTQDLYFCGATKDRHKLLIKLNNALKSNTVRTQFDVFYIKKNENHLKELQDNIYVQKLSKMKEYSDTLKDMISSNCILELVTPSQSATFTLRDYEAVVYNKKLLTNNKAIYTFPFYNENYMKYFQDIDDIDFKWIKKDIEVDYDYSENYSPNKLIEEISRINESR